MIYCIRLMTTVPGKSDKPVKAPPLILRSFVFGLMLLAWWIATVELPGRNLFLIVAQNAMDRHFSAITIWAYGSTQALMQYRWLGVIGIFLGIGAHYFFSVRQPRYDIYGKWLFKTAFLVLYIILYGYFFMIFIGAELPIWTWPAQVTPAGV
jgi:hypothetical protein